MGSVNRKPREEVEREVKEKKSGWMVVEGRCKSKTHQGCTVQEIMKNTGEKKVVTRQLTCKQGQPNPGRSEDEPELSDTSLVDKNLRRLSFLLVFHRVAF
jgi:hypothetical protein